PETRRCRSRHPARGREPGRAPPAAEHAGRGTTTCVLRRHPSVRIRPAPCRGHCLAGRFAASESGEPEKRPVMAGALRGRVLTDNAGDTIHGIGLAAAAYGVLSIGDASAKWVILTCGVAWVLMWRGLFGALAVGAVTITRNRAGGWRR